MAKVTWFVECSGYLWCTLVWQLFYASNIDIVRKKNQDSQMPTINYTVYLVYHYSTFYF